MKNKKNNKNSIIDIIKYHFDNLFFSGLTKKIICLFLITIIFVLLISIPAIFFDGSKVESEIPQFEILYNNFATVINQWWPFSYDNDFVANKMFITLFVRVVIAVFGLFFTSILISIISEAVENKIREFQQGKSKVIEKGHIVVIGYDVRNHTLIKELILSIKDKKQKQKILIIDEKIKEEIEEDIYLNVNIPSNVKIIIRTMKLWDVEGLRQCSIENSSVIVISPISDIWTLKVVFALKKILKEYPNSKTRIVSGINSDELKINFSNDKDIMFSIDDLIAKVITTSNYQFGLSNVLKSILSFDGAEFYVRKSEMLVGKKFKEIVCNMINGMPIGLIRDGNLICPPNIDEKVLKNDELLYFAETRDSYERFNNKINDGLNRNGNKNVVDNNDFYEKSVEKVLIIGYNHKTSIILNNIRKNVKEILYVGMTNEQKELIKNIIECKTDINIRYLEIDINNKESLIGIVNNVNHIIILTNDDIQDELSDVKNMLLYLRLIKIRKQLKLNYTIITELKSNDNKELIDSEDENDFIVSSNIVAMMLVQMANEIKLKNLIFQLLEEKGINIVLKYTNNHEGYEGSVNTLRLSLLNEGYIFLGYSKGKKNQYVYNPKGNEKIVLESEDRLILLEKSK